LSSLDAELPFGHIAIDFKEFPRSRYGNTYVLVTLDVLTRFVFLRALPDKTMTTVGRALLDLFFDIGFFFKDNLIR
jgi:hypothetical protein